MTDPVEHKAGDIDDAFLSDLEQIVPFGKLVFSDIPPYVPTAAELHIDYDDSGGLTED